VIAGVAMAVLPLLLTTAGVEMQALLPTMDGEAIPLPVPQPGRSRCLEIRSKMCASTRRGQA